MRTILLALTLIFYSSISNSIEFNGKFEQGSFIVGKTQKGSSVEIDNRKVRLTKDGYFVFGLDRDRKKNIVIKVRKNEDIQVIEKKVLKRDYKVQKID